MKMKITIASPEKMFYCGDADEIRLRTVAGEIKILPGHAQYIAEVGRGAFRIASGARMLAGRASGGIICNRSNEISLLLFEPIEFDSEA